MTPRSDAHWLDARRQQRKTRLRQKARGEVVSPEVEINTLLPEDAVEGARALKWDFPASHGYHRIRIFDGEFGV
jgi:hypothetical protein